MQTFDLIMAVVLGGSILIGAWKGMIWQISMVSSIVVSFFVAREFHGGLANAMSDIGEPWNKYLAMGAIYILTSLAIWMVHSFLQKRLEKHDMKTFDHQTGGLMGIVNGALLCCLLTVTMIAFTDEESHKTIGNSKSGVYVNKMVSAIRKVIPEDIVEPVNEHFDKLDLIIQQRDAEQTIDDTVDNAVEDLKDEIKEALE